MSEKEMPAINLSEFYDNLVLRDLLQYTAPGAVVILGFGLLFESLNTSLGLGIPGLALSKANPWPSLVLRLFSSYVTGHILTSIHTYLFRTGERKLASETLGSSAPCLARR